MKRGAYILPYFDHLPKEFEVGTPIVTTDVPLNSTYIKDYQLGIAKKQWNKSDLNDVVSNSEMYIENCMIQTFYKTKGRTIFRDRKRKA